MSRVTARSIKSRSTDPSANAIDAATSRALFVAFRAFNDDPDARVAILTGAGDRFFSAGWDLDGGGRRPRARKQAIPTTAPAASPG